jgi:hypothetical protein
MVLIVTKKVLSLFYSDIIPNLALEDTLIDVSLEAASYSVLIFYVHLSTSDERLLFVATGINACDRGEDGTFTLSV